MSESTASLSPSTEKKKTAPIVALLILIYVIVALSDNFKGIFVPFFKAEFSVSNTQIGYVMTASLFAYAVFQYIGGMMIERIGYKKVLAIGFALGIAATALLMNCSSFQMLIACMFLLNVGMAMFNIGVNTLGPVLPVASTAVLMNIINCSYGASNTVVQKVSGELLARGISWRKFFMVMMLMLIALFVYMLIIKIPFQPAVSAEKKSKKHVFQNKMLYFYICIAGFYLASEYGIGNWFVNYMSESFSMTADQTSFYISLFFLCRTIGLACGGFIADKLGHFRTIMIYGTVATLTCAIGIAMGQSGLLLFSIGGFAFSAIFPTIITTITPAFKEDTSYATGLILMCGTLIAMVISMAIGVLNDVPSIGTRYAFFMIPVALLMTTIFSRVIRKAQSKQQEA